jgi:hypothetical protein
VSTEPRSVQKPDLFSDPSAARTRYGGLRCYPVPMRWTFDPFRLLLISIAGWLGQQQRDAVDYRFPRIGIGMSQHEFDNNDYHIVQEILVTFPVTFPARGLCGVASS